MSLFITLEGLDGCGKSTQIQLLSNWLKAEGRSVVHIREPGGCSISEQIRTILLNKENNSMHSKTELLLYFAARSQLIQEVIKPALAKGHIVVADRFGWATYAYQGYGRQMSISDIHALRKLACDDVWPDHSFLLDIQVETMKSRLPPGSQQDRMELAGEDFFKRTRNGYLILAKNNPNHFTVLNGTLSVESLSNQINSSVQQLIAESNSAI